MVRQGVEVPGPVQRAGRPIHARKDAVTQSRIRPPTALAAWAEAPLPRFLVKRLGSLLLVVWVVEIATFLMVRVMPGDPARQVLGPHASAQAVASLRDQ